MTEEQFKRGLHLIRYVGILVTVLFFVAGLTFSAIIPTAPGAPSSFGLFLPYVLLVTVIIAVLSLVFYFGYNAIQGGKVKKS